MVSKYDSCYEKRHLRWPDPQSDYGAWLILGFGYQISSTYTHVDNLCPCILLVLRSYISFPTDGRNANCKPLRFIHSLILSVRKRNGKCSYYSESDYGASESHFSTCRSSISTASQSSKSKRIKVTNKTPKSPSANNNTISTNAIIEGPLRFQAALSYKFGTGERSSFCFKSLSL